MRRRHLLATLAGLPGCLGVGKSDDRTPTPTRTRHRTTSKERPTVESTTETNEYDTFESDPRPMDVGTVEKQLERHDCGFSKTNLVHCGDDSANDLSIVASPTIGELPNGEITLTVRNDTDRTFEMGPYDWKLYKFSDGTWRQLAPLRVPASTYRIEGGRTYEYQLRFQREFRGFTGYVSRGEIQIGGLGPGVYGFGVDGWFRDVPDETFSVAIPVGLAGSGPHVRPTDGVTVNRDGSTLVVSDPATDRKGTFSIELLDGARGITLLDEHLMQTVCLQNTVPFGATQEIERIRFVGGSRDVRAAKDYLQMVGQGGLESRFSYRTVSFVVND